VKPGINTNQIEYNWTKKSRSTARLSIPLGRKWKINESGLLHDINYNFETTDDDNDDDAALQ
jgi:hypothetical protein